MSFYRSDGLLTEASTEPQIPDQYTYRDIADPYSCTLDVWTSVSGYRKLQEALSPILKGLDPTFKFVCVQQHKCSRPPVYMPCGGPATYRDNGPINRAAGISKQLATPALAVVLFLREGGPLSAEDVWQKLQCPPWQFHHKIELSNVRRMPKVGCMAQQQYYSLGSTPSSVPLWSVNSVHYGNEHLRFTVFTKSHKQMVDFYRMLSGREVDCRKTHFALFELYTQPGLDVQLGLKHSPSLDPRPTTSAFLHFKVKSLKAIAPLLYHSCTALSDGMYITKDPDGNGVILEEEYRGETVAGALSRSSLASKASSSMYCGSGCHGNSDRGPYRYSFHNNSGCKTKNVICSNQESVHCNVSNSSYVNGSHSNSKHIGSTQCTSNQSNRSRSSLDSEHFSPMGASWDVSTGDITDGSCQVEEIIV